VRGRRIAVLLSHQRWRRVLLLLLLLLHRIASIAVVQLISQDCLVLLLLLLNLLLLLLELSGGRLLVNSGRLCLCLRRRLEFVTEFDQSLVNPL
jgi:hypothetical protein